MRRRAGAVTGVVGLLMVSLAGLPAPVAAAPRGTPAPEPHLRYIVRTTSASATSGVAGGVRRAGGRVDNVYAKAITGFSASLTAAQAAELKDDRQVRSVTPDVRFHTTDVQTDPTWGLDRIDQRTVNRNGTYRYTATGAGVTAFVVDTGIRFGHHQFGGRASSGYDFVGRDANAADCEGHGTHVSGTIGGSTYGAAKQVSLVSVRVLDCEGSGWAGDIIDGMDWIIAHKPAGPAVVNMSIGGEAYPLIDDAVARTVAAGITVVVAAGNDGGDACLTSPAREPSAITVAATDSKDRRPDFSNYGSCVDLFAPGVNVRSASITSTKATEVLSGTSMATPHVVGLAARYLQTHPSATPAGVTTALLDAATTKAVHSPSGSPNRLLYATPPTVVPGAPAKLKVSTSSKARTATLGWSKPRDNGGKAITGYLVSRNGTDTRGATAVNIALPATARSYRFGHLRKGHAYRLYVRAVSEIGRGTVAAKTAPKLR